MYTLKELRSATRHRSGKLLGATFVLILVAAVILILVAVFATAGLLAKGNESIHIKSGRSTAISTQKDQQHRTAVIAELSQINDASSETKDHKWRGLCKRGANIRSAADFEREVAKDPVLLRHFQDEGFNFANARMVSKDVETIAYVTHREDDVIAMTSRRITIPANDPMVTDDRGNTARVLCCNDVREESIITPPPTPSLIPYFAPPAVVNIEDSPPDGYLPPREDFPVVDVFGSSPFYTASGHDGSTKSIKSDSRYDGQSTTSVQQWDHGSVRCDHDGRHPSEVPEPPTTVLLFVGFGLLFLPKVVKKITRIRKTNRK